MSRVPSEKAIKWGGSLRPLFANTRVSPMEDEKLRNAATIAGYPGELYATWIRRVLIAEADRILSPSEPTKQTNESTNQAEA